MSLKIDYQVSDYGVLQYEYNDAKTIYDAPAKQKLGIKPMLIKIYMCLIAVGMLAWFLYSIIAQSVCEGFKTAFVSHLLWFFMFIIIELILLLSVFSAWGKFARFALRRNLVNRRGRGRARVNQLEAELQAADGNLYRESGLCVYSSFIVIMDKGEKTVLNRTELSCISAKPTNDGRWLNMEFSSDIENEKYFALVPYTDLITLRSIFSEQLNVEESPQKSAKPEPMLFVMFGIVILIGVALIVLHFTLLHDMPLIFGVFFASMGVLFIIIQFNRFAIIREGIVPLLASIILSTMLISVLSLLAQIQDIKFNFAYVFSVYDYKAVLVFFLTFMPILFTGGIVGMIKSIRYHK